MSFSFPWRRGLPGRRRTVALLVFASTVLASTHGQAWPPELERALYRDAQRLLPRSLALLLREREREVLAAARDPRPELIGLGSELTAGAIRPETAGAIDAQLRDATELL